ncbi:MAG: rod shape-determining protein MreD [Treponema sp.]|nr:rod shape-determining protein MreD [Treponema sp.]
MIRSIAWTVVFGIIAAFLQSTLLSRLAIYRAVPDIALVILVYSAYVNGVMAGQLSGFFGGIALDFISAAPLGLNAFIRTLAGALTGLLKGMFFLDAFLLPMILCACATLFKMLIFFLLNLLMPDIIPAYSLVTPLLWVEMAQNAIAAPFLFAFLKRFRPMLAIRNEI